VKRGETVAALAFVVVLGLACVVGYFTGFWSSLAPYVFDKGGPLGLEGGVAVTLVISVGLIAVQVLSTYLIVSVGLGARERKRRLHDREQFCGELVHHYVDLTQTYLRFQTRLPSKTQRVYLRAKKEWDALLLRYERALSPSEIEAVRRIANNYDEVVYDEKWDGLDRVEKDAKDLFPRLLLEPPGERLARLFSRTRKAPWQTLLDKFLGPVRKLVLKLQNIPPAQRAAMLDRTNGLEGENYAYSTATTHDISGSVLVQDS